MGNKHPMIFKYSDFLTEDKTPTQALQDMFDASAAGDDYVTIDLEGYHIKTTETVFYHKGHGRITLVKGNNALIEAINVSETGKVTPGTHDILVPDKGFGFKVGNGGVEDIMSYIDAIKVRDVTFSRGGTQLRVAGSLHSEISGCRFSRGRRGIHLIFALHTKVSHCSFYGAKVEDVCVRSGLGDAGLMSANGVEPEAWDEKYFSNATGTNSQSNRTWLEHCRFYGSQDQTFCLRVQASDGVQVNNCIFEGSAVPYSIYNDSRGSQTTRFIQINEVHIEHGKPGITKALIYNRGCKLELTGLYQQYGHVVIVEQVGGEVMISRTRYILLTDNCFKMDMCNYWYFENSSMHPPAIMRKNADGTHACWVDNKVPRMLKQDGIKGKNYMGRYGDVVESDRGNISMIVSSYGETQAFVDFKQPEGSTAQLMHSFKTQFDRVNVAKKLDDSGNFSLGAVKAQYKKADGTIGWSWFRPVFENKGILGK